MHKCWNCGTEHEILASDDAYLRGQQAAVERIKARLIEEMCRGYCNMCDGIAMSISIINDEFGLYNESSS